MIDENMTLTNFTAENVTLSNVTDVTSNETSSTQETSDSVDVMFILRILLSSIGIIANLTVIFVLRSNKKYRNKIPNIYIINQSILDFTAATLLLLITLTIRDAYYVHNDGILGSLECRLWNNEFMLWSFFVASTWNIVSLTFERYLELVHTMWHKSHFKKSWIYTGFICNIIFCILFHGGFMIPTSKVVSGKCYIWYFWPSELFNSAFGVFITFVQFIFPLIILLYCYGRILWVLTRRIDSNVQKNETASTSKTEIKMRDTFQLARTNTIKTFLLVGLFFIICWSNDQIYYLMYNLGYSLNMNGTYYRFNVLMIFINCTINPFIYLAKYRDYQNALKDLFYRCKKQSDRGDSEISYSNNTSETAVSNQS